MKKCISLVFILAVTFLLSTFLYAEPLIEVMWW